MKIVAIFGTFFYLYYLPSQLFLMKINLFEFDENFYGEIYHRLAFFEVCSSDLRGSARTLLIIRKKYSIRPYSDSNFFMNSITLKFLQTNEGYEYNVAPRVIFQQRNNFDDDRNVLCACSVVFPHFSVD